MVLLWANDNLTDIEYVKAWNIGLLVDVVHENSTKSGSYGFLALLHYKPEKAFKTY